MHVIPARRDWRWWLPWRLGLLVAVLTCTGVVTAKSAYWFGFSNKGEAYLPVAGQVPGGPSVRPSGEVWIEVEVVDGAGGPTRTEELVISTAPEPGVAGMIGVGVMLAVLRRRRGVRAA